MDETGAYYSEWSKPESKTSIQYAVAAAAKSLQSCPTLCNLIDGSPPGSPIPGILQARTLEWVAISFSNAWKWKVKVKSLSRVQLLAVPWTIAHQAPPSMEFSSQEYWSGVPLPSPQYSILMHIYGIWKDDDNNPICEPAKETQMYITVFWTLWERARVGWLGRMALKHVCYHMWNESPVQVWCMRQGVRGWCNGMTHRDEMGREVAGGVQDGEHMYTHGRFMSIYGKTTTIL